MAAGKGSARASELPVRIALPEWATREAALLLLANVYHGGALNGGGASGGGRPAVVALGKANPQSFELVLGLLRLVRIEKRRRFLRRYCSTILKTRSICQDRLGTKTGKVERLTHAFFLQADMMAMVYAKEWAEEWLAASDVLDVSAPAKAHKQKAPRFLETVEIRSRRF